MHTTRWRERSQLEYRHNVFVAKVFITGAYHQPPRITDLACRWYIWANDRSPPDFPSLPRTPSNLPNYGLSLLSFRVQRFSFRGNGISVIASRTEDLPDDWSSQTALTRLVLSIWSDVPTGVADFDVTLDTSLMMTFQYLEGIVRLWISPFTSFRRNKRLMLVLWRGILLRHVAALCHPVPIE